MTLTRREVVILLILVNPTVTLQSLKVDPPCISLGFRFNFTERKCLEYFHSNLPSNELSPLQSDLGLSRR